MILIFLVFHSYIMSNRFKDLGLIDEEKKRQLENLGLKEYQGKKLNTFCNPFSKTYLLTNVFLFSGCLYSKIQMHKLGMPGRSIPTIAMCSLIWFTLWERRRFDFPNAFFFETLEQKLELSPITRNAYQQALIENRRF